MNLTLNKNEPIVKEYTFTLPKEKLEQIVEMRAKYMQNKTKMAGFRKGHVPLDIIKKKNLADLIEKGVFSALDLMLTEEFKKNDYRLATEPRIERKKLDDSKIDDVEIVIQVELMPDLSDIKYEKFAREIPRLAMTEDELEKELQSIAESYSSVKEVADPESKTAMGHIVNINFEGKVDNVAFEGGIAENYLLEIGSKSFIDTFEEQLVGMAVGDEKDIHVTFPQQYHKEDLAGKKAVFTVKINKIYDKIVPECNDEFAQKIGLASLAQLKENIQSSITKMLNSAFVGLVKEKLLKEIGESLDFAIPPSILEAHIKHHIAREKHKGHDHHHEHGEACHHEADENFDEDSVRAEVEKTAPLDIRIAYLIQYMSQLHNVKVTKEDFRTFVVQEAIARGVEDPKILLDLYDKNPKAKASVEALIAENKAIEHLLTTITNNELKLSKKDFNLYLKDIK